VDSPDEPEPPLTGDKKPPLWPGVLLLLAAFLGAAGAGVYRAWMTLSFERTDGAQYKEWVYAEFGRAAGIGFLVAVGASVAVALLRRRHARFAIAAPVAAVVVVAALVGAASFSRAQRLHPVAQERDIVSAIPLPADWGAGTVTVLPTEPDPFDDSPPRVERIIDVRLPYSQVCRQLVESVNRWEGARLSSPDGDHPLAAPTPTPESGLGCSWYGVTPRGWAIRIRALVRSPDAAPEPGALGNIPARTTRVVMVVSTPDA
jgi:hypothetical protein